MYLLAAAFSIISAGNYWHRAPVGIKRVGEFPYIYIHEYPVVRWSENPEPFSHFFGSLQSSAKLLLKPNEIRPRLGSILSSR